MNKLHRFYVVLIALQLIFPGIVGFCFGQAQDASMTGASEKIYAIQVAASKVYIDPEFFKQKFNLTENVRYFCKDGWYKYIIGSYKTETEATKKLAGLKFEAFVTSVIENRSLPESSVSPSDTSQLSQSDSLKSQINESELRRIYNQKIRDADSAFNISKNLLLATQLYQEASLIEPDKNYPKDQIIEIDKQLTQNQSQSIFSKLTLRVYIIAGFAATLILVLGITLVIRARSQKRIRQKSTENKKQVLIDEIMQLYPNLASEISKKLKETCLDQELVHDEIERCLNSTNEVLRMEAELALIRLDIDDPFSFLDKLHQEFTSWEQLHVFEMIKRNRVSIPDFSRWLNSPNETIVLFCRRMIGAFKQDYKFGIEAVHAPEEIEPTGVKGIDDMLRNSDEDLQAVAGQILNNKINQ
ncbi:MAG: SPOR domain-containing protein [Bacteroidales bacterium]